MANNIAGRERSFTGHAVEEFIPSAAWSENSLSHILLVDLPAFKKDEVKLKVDYESKHITVSGQRLMSNNKYKYFNKTFKAPENSEIEKTTGKFEGEIFYVTIPKKPLVQDKPSGDEIRSTENNEEESKKLGFCVKNEIGNDKKSNNKDNIVEEKPTGNEIRSSSESNGGDEKKKEERKKGSCVDEFDKQDIKKWEKECSLWEKTMKMVSENKDILVAASLAFSLGVLVSRKFDSVR